MSHWGKAKGRVVSVAMAGCLFLSSCSFLNQYPEVPEPSDEEIEKVKDVPLAYSLAFAKKYRNAYREKLSERAVLINSVTPVLTLTAAGALGLAAYGAHTDKILGLGLAGGTGYTIANFFSNNTQELIYLGGMEAMSCAIEAVLPLNLSSSALEALKKDLKKLNDQIDVVKNAMSEVEQHKAASSNAALNQKANVAKTKSLQAVQDADLIYAAGQKLMINVDGAGGSLLSAINSISDSVDKALQESQPRIAALRDIVGQITRASTVFAPSPTFAGTFSSRLAGEKPKPQGATISPLETALDALAKETAELASLSRRVSAIVNTVNEKRPLETLKRCGVDIDKTSTDITVSTGQVSFTEKKMGHETIIIDGGTSPYIGKFLSSPHEGLSVDNPIPGDHSLVVRASDKTVAGTYSLLITDSAKHRKIVEIAVVANSTGNKPEDETEGEKPGDATPLKTLADLISGKPLAVDGLPAGVTLMTGTAAPKADGSGISVPIVVKPADANVNLDNFKAKIIGALGDLEIDGKKVADLFEENENLSALGDFEQIFELSKGAATPQSAAIVPVKKAPLPPTKASFGDIVKNLGPLEIGNIQFALCMENRDGAWGNDTQKALRQWRKQNKGKIDGPLTAQERDALLVPPGSNGAGVCKGAS